LTTHHLKNINSFGVTMRDTLIEQQFEIQALNQGFWQAKLLKYFPRLKGLIKYFLLPMDIRTSYFKKGHVE